MGVDAIVIVENRRNITLDAFIAAMNASPWGKKYALGYEDEPVWESFEWEGKSYFSLIDEYPRYAWLFEDEWDFEENKRCSNPRFSYTYLVAFCKAMQVVEQITGGVIFLGNDVILSRTPDSTYRNEEFMLPSELDGMLDGWRTIAALPIKPEELV